MSGLVVTLKVDGVVRCVDYSRPGEVWADAVTRLVNRFLYPDGHYHYIAMLQTLPFAEFGNGRRYRILTAYRAHNCTVPDGEIEAIITPRRTPEPNGGGERQHKRRHATTPATTHRLPLKPSEDGSW